MDFNECIAFREDMKNKYNTATTKAEKKAAYKALMKNEDRLLKFMAKPKYQHAEYDERRKKGLEK